MNRAMRRAALKAKPVDAGKVVPLPKWLDEFIVFDNIDRVFQKIGHGEIEFANGRPVMMAGDGHWYEVIPALNGWISAWKRFDRSLNLNHDLSPLVRLSNRLNYNSPISQHQLMSARAVLNEQRKLFRKLDRDDLESLAKTEQIALFLEDKAA